jgi:hypothetical protein
MLILHHSSTLTVAVSLEPAATNPYQISRAARKMPVPRGMQIRCKNRLAVERREGVRYLSRRSEGLEAKDDPLVAIAAMVRFILAAKTEGGTDESMSSDMLQLSDFELRPYRSNDSI